MIKYGNFIFSMITAIVAVIALSQTHKQIKISNKQHLFDKRMENYLIAKGLIQLYRNNCMIFNNEEDEPIFDAKLYFVWLTNNTYLEQITPAISDVLNPLNHKNLLIKLEDLKEISTKIRLLFPNKTGYLLADFVLKYQQLLHSLYKYQILLKDMDKMNEAHKFTLEEIQEKIGEEKYRIELKTAFDSLRKGYNLIEIKNVEERVEKQIKLY